MAQELELTGSAGSLTLDESQIFAKDLEKVHTGVGTARIEVPENDSIIPFVQRQDRANYRVDGNTVFSGYVVGLSGNDRTGQWTLRIDGVAKRLEETRPDYDSLGGSLTYSNIALEEALKDYWPRTPFNASVTDESTELVAEALAIQSVGTQSEWEAEIEIAASDPAQINNGALETTQIAYTREGDETDAESGTPQGLLGDVYSGGSAQTISDTGDRLEYTFTPEHDIPAGELDVYVRDDDGGAGQGSDGSVAFEWRFDGTLIDELTQTGVGLTLGWSSLSTQPYSAAGGWDSPSLNAGDTYTISVECTAGGSLSDQYSIDVFSPVDKRYENQLFFDDDNGGSGGYLDGPELYPQSFEVQSEPALAGFNITASDFVSSWNDVSGSQSVGVSNDGVVFFTAANTQTTSQNYTSAGRTARVKFELGRTDDTRNTATPRTGYLTQSVDFFSHKVDLNDLTVIDSLELSRNHFDNLKKLSNYGGFNFTIEHDDVGLANLIVESYPRGRIPGTTPTALQNPKNRSPEVAAELYFNKVYLQGALRDDGSRPTAEASDSNAISNDNREITPGVLRDTSITTESGAVYRANALLDTALDNNDLRGSITTTPAYIQPGYSYEIDFGEGLDFKTLERINIRESAGQINATYEFVTKPQLADTLDELKRDQRDVGDQV